MKIDRKILGTAAALFVLAFSTPGRASSPFAPTSFEVLYQPTYTLATGGPTSQLSALGGGIKLCFGMTPVIAFELGGYYDGYTFGGISGSSQTAYAARATGDFALAPSPLFRIYAGIDANVFFSPPGPLSNTGNKDLGAIGGLRFLVGGATKVVLGAEYRWAANTVMSYSGGTVNNHAVLGTIGLHFGSGL